MKTILLLISMCAFIFRIHAQAPGIEWEFNIGGLGWDECRTICETTDGGFICGGFSESDVSGNKLAPSNGQYDFYLVKLDIFGNLAWEKSYGGSLRDQMYRAEPTADGGYILGGWSESLTDGNKTAPNYGARDCWVIKTDADGNIEWQTTVGGDQDDYIFTLHQLTDGGYIFGGFSNSGISGNKTEPNLGGFDFFIFKLDADGNLVWQNTIGGSGEDRLHAIIELNEGGFICGGTSESSDFDHTSPISGIEDYWVLKLDEGGNIIWDKSYGGNDVDELFDMHEDEEGNFILAGFTSSDMSGDVTEPIIGMQDGWAVKLDNDGNIVWQNTIGGDMGDRLECAYVMSDGNYFMGSGSFSPVSGDQTEESWDWDYWLKKLDQSTGEIIWQTNLGGYGVDLPRTIIQTSDNSFAICGESTSGAGLEKSTPNYGEYDFWIIKVGCENPVMHYADEDGDGYGNNDISINTCTNYPGYALNNWDCDYTDPLVYAGAAEICNDADDNCDGNIDEGVVATYYFDGDDDGYGDPDITIIDCPAPFGYVIYGTDCDDANTGINPGVAEICNGIDDNCDANIDEGVLTTYYEDADDDGYGNALSIAEECSMPSGYTLDNSDCDDTNSAISPDGTEICNYLDDNCDANIDEGVQSTYYEDADHDGFGNELSTVLDCSLPEGFSIDHTDCDDTNEFIYPGATEVLNGLDDNCNGEIDEGLVEINEIETAYFSIFPNPVQNELVLIKNIQSAEFAEIEIMNTLGEIIATVSSSESTIRINVADFSAGIYFILVNENKLLHLQKFVKG